MAVASLVVAIGSAIGALVAALYAGSAARASRALARIEGDRRAEELARHEAEKAAARRADVRLRVDDGRLILSNRGPATAIDIRVEPVATVGEGHLPRAVIDGPVTLRAGEEHRFHLAITLGTAARMVCHLAWQDDEGMHTERPEVRVLNA